MPFSNKAKYAEPMLWAFLHRMRIFIQRLTERRNARHLKNKSHFVEELRGREIS